MTTWNDLKQEKQFLFSVIIPIFDSARYLNDAIDSILKQSIGFEDSIQVVLVNNGSNDNSSYICKELKMRFPDNIVYIECKENKGISEGRNLGMQYAKGKYINFMDSDDYWEFDAFKTAYDFFELNYNDIDCVACRIKQFESTKKYLYLDYKFKNDEVVDITKSYSYVQLAVASVFIKYEVAIKFKFSNLLRGEEDNRYITEIVLEKGKYGILSSVRYYYRKRRDKSNALSLYSNELEFYKTNITHGIEYLIDYSQKKYGVIIPYVQFTVMCMLCIRLKNNQCEFLNQEELRQYRNRLGKVLKFIDDYIILDQRIIFSEYKIFALKLKYENEFEKLLQIKGKEILLNDTPVFSFSKGTILDLYVLEIVNGNLRLHGNAGIPFKEFDYEVFFRDSENKVYKCQNTQAYRYEKKSLGSVVLVKDGFNIMIPLNQTKLRINAFIKINGEEYKLKIRFKDWSKLSNQVKNLYYEKEEFVVKKYDKGIVVYRTKKRARYELELWYELLRLKKYKVVVKRALIKLIKKIKNKHQIWLFVDRVNMANENAEFLFKHIAGKRLSNIHCFYALNKSSEDYERIKKYGHIVEFNSFKFSLLYLIADCYITSQTTGFILKPSKVGFKFYKDIYPPFIYLQHGVLEKDLSSSQNKIAHNLRVFITSAYDEYKSLLKYPYGYSEREVKLTGLARHDLILSPKYTTGKRRIVIAPTWRKNLSTNIDPVNGGRGYNSQFKNSLFYRFYNGLINDTRVLEAMKKNGYEGVFKPHPYLYEQSIDFQENDIFKVQTHGEEYSKQFNNSCLLVTDYSSIATDYAYSNCAVIYTQFDKDVFYEGHTYDKGFFDYERDGFGPVCYDYESTIRAILGAIENKCEMEAKYQKRRKTFFAYFDGKNRDRIYHEILNLDKEK